MELKLKLSIWSNDCEDWKVINKKAIPFGTAFFVVAIISDYFFFFAAFLAVFFAAFLAGFFAFFAIAFKV
jgi:hypothetical protein